MLPVAEPPRVLCLLAMLPSQHRQTDCYINLQQQNIGHIYYQKIQTYIIQGIIDSAGTGTFAKEPKLVELFCLGTKSTPMRCHKKTSAGFSRMFVTLNLVGQHVNGHFFANINVLFYSPA